MARATAGEGVRRAGRCGTPKLSGRGPGGAAAPAALLLWHSGSHARRDAFATRAARPFGGGAMPEATPIRPSGGRARDQALPAQRDIDAVPSRWPDSSLGATLGSCIHTGSRRRAAPARSRLANTACSVEGAPHRLTGPYEGTAPFGPTQSRPGPSKRAGGRWSLGRQGSAGLAREDSALARVRRQGEHRDP
jgi:hypothetical protein